MRNQVTKIFLQTLALDARPVLDHREDAVPQRLIVRLLHALDDLVTSLLERPLEPLELARSEP